MFRAVPLPIIRSSPLYIRHWYMSCNFVDTFQASSGWKSILNVLESCYKTCTTYTSAECTVENSWLWAEEQPETCRVSWKKNKFGKISTSFGFIKKKFITMHGYMNIKFYTDFGKNKPINIFFSIPFRLWSSSESSTIFNYMQDMQRKCPAGKILHCYKYKWIRKAFS